MTAAAIMTEALEREFVDESDFSPGGERPHSWASQWKACGRAMALDLLHPEDRSGPSPDGCARMAHGKDFEALLRGRLERAGRRSDPRFEVEGAQEHWKIYHRADPGRVVLTGKTDGKIRISGEGQGIVFEVKRGVSFARCETVDDLLTGRWSAASVYQLLAYLLGLDLQEGLLIIDSGGMPRLIPIRLDDHLELAEDFRSKAEKAAECKHNGEELPSFAENPELCAGCDHRGKSCAPPWDSGEGPWVSGDAALVETVETCLRTREAAKDYGRSWERLKELCRGKELVMIGPYTVTGKAQGNGWKLKIEGEAAAPDPLTPEQRIWWNSWESYEGPIPCGECGAPVPGDRRLPAFAVPTCHACLPPAAKLESVALEDVAPADRAATAFPDDPKLAAEARRWEALGVQWDPLTEGSPS